MPSEAKKKQQQKKKDAAKARQQTTVKTTTAAKTKPMNDSKKANAAGDEKYENGVNGTEEMLSEGDEFC